MPDDRSAVALRLITSAAYDYYVEHGRPPARVRVGSMVAGYFLKAGQREVAIALRPGGTTIWIAVIVDNALGPLDIVVES